MPESKSLGLGGFSRRSFIKGAAALTATGLLAGCTPDTEELESAESTVDPRAGKEDLYRGACRSFCSGGCSLQLHVRDGAIVRVTAGDFPDNSYQRICSKGLTEPYRVYAADRLQYPMRRTGERGEGEFERISWDDAIAEIASKWQAIIDESGTSAIGVMTDTGNNGFLGSGIMVMSVGSMIQRFKKAFGFTTLDSINDRANTTAISRMLGSEGQCQSNEPVDYENCKTMLIWNAMPATAQIQSAHFFLEAKENGTKIYWIDPVFNQSALLADEWVPIRPGSDGALAFGMLNVIVDNGWQNTEFLKTKSNAAFLVKDEDSTFLRLSDLGQAEADSEEDDYVVMGEDGKVAGSKAAADPKLDFTGDVEGKKVTSAYRLLLDRAAEYPLAKASEITGVPENKITEIAEAYACDTPAAIYSVFGGDHYYNGHWSFSCILALPIFTGNLGRSGSFIECFREHPTNILNLAEVGNVEAVAASKYIPTSKVPAVVASGEFNGEPFKIRSVFMHSANPFVNLAARNTVEEWMKTVEYIVCVDNRMTDSCKFADILLPACGWYEYEDVCGRGIHHPYALWNDKAIEPLFESKPDFEIMQLLAKALGRSDDEFGFTSETWFQMLFDTDVARERGISYESIKEQKTVRMFAPETHIAYKNGFGTASGRAEIFTENDNATERMPYWEPPKEAWAGSEAQQKYPYQLMSEKPKFRTHSQWGNVELFREYEAEPTVRMCPADAEANDVKTGDTVRLFNDRGYVVLKATVVPNLPQGVFQLTKGWSADDYIDGNYSDLTMLETNPFCNNSAFFDLTVGIEKA